MGPSTGSPAAETQQNIWAPYLAGRNRGRRVKCFFIGLGSGFLAAFLCFLPAQCWARSVETTHNVSVVVVEPALSLSDDTGDFSLTLDRGDAGSSSSTQVVNYRVYGNVVPTTAVEGVLSGKLSTGPEGIEIAADVGSFANGGTSGQIQMGEHSPGFQTVGADLVPLVDKGASSGSYGGVINGTIPITWKATTTKDLPAGNYPVILTVTLKDS